MGRWLMNGLEWRRPGYCRRSGAGQGGNLNMGVTRVRVSRHPPETWGRRRAGCTPFPVRRFWAEILVLISVSVVSKQAGLRDKMILSFPKFR